MTKLCKSIKSAILLIVLLNVTNNALAEKYFTWVDEMGRVHHTVIPEEKNPLIIDEKPALIINKKNLVILEEKEKSSKNVEFVDELVDEDVSPTASPSESPAVPLVIAPLFTPVLIDDEEEEDKTLSGKVTETGTVAPALKTPSFDLNSEQPASLDAISVDSNLSEVDSSASDIQKKKEPADKSSEINEDDYIDGDVLVEQGGVRDDNDLPYFTWTDELGVVRSSPYRPKAKRSGSDKKNKVTNIPEVYTVSEEYLNDTKEQIKSSGITIDDYAKKLFFSESSVGFIDTFKEKCCENMTKTTPYLLEFENSVYLEIDKKTETHLFSEGKSPFLLIKLPPNKVDYGLEIKTFVTSSGRTGIKNGVFYPQLIFLNSNYDVIRILRNPALEYTAENWFRHGYLKGLFKVELSQGERYLLINTTRKNLQAQQYVEQDESLTLNYQNVGGFEVGVKLN